ncbi:major facilitator superfamily domain-containing protein [Hyaloraphidium curvatum]|nr:major facilitator superfamily domain-containing protein [Hyaloraphidium curvatum]
MPSDTGAGKSPTAPPSNEADPPDNAVEVLSDAGEAPPTEVPFYDRFTPLRKRLIVLLVSFAALMGPLGTHFYAPALTTIAEELQASETLVNLTVTIYSIVLSVAPLVWGPLSDRVGRRPIYLASSSVFVVGCLGCFFSANVGMLVAFRFLQGTGSSAVMSVGAGTIADTHRKEERGRAMGMYWVIPLMSPVISSPIGGVVCQYLGWRYVFLISLGLGSVIFLCILVFLPETLPASKRKAKKPPSMLAGIYALRYPFVAFVTLDACCLFAALWSLNSMLPYIYTNAYGFTSSMVGAAMAATACGNLCGSLFGGYYADMTIIKWKRRRNGIMVAEDRLRTTWLAGLCVPIGLLLFGWAPAKGLTVAMAIIGQFLIGYGTLSATSSENTFLIDCFSDSPASIVSANNCVRYLAASVMPVVSPGGVSALGSGWFYTIVAAAKTVGTLSVTWVAARGSRYRLSKEPWASQELVPVKGWYEDWVADVEKKRARREKWFGPAWRAVTGRPGPWEAEGWGGVPPAPPAPGDAQVEVKTLPEGADAQVDVKEVVSK